MATLDIDVAKDFSVQTGPGLIEDGQYSGEAFRQQCLEPPLREGHNLRVNFEGCHAILTMFYREALGPLVEEFGPVVIDRVEIISPAVPVRVINAMREFRSAVQ